MKTFHFIFFLLITTSSPLCAQFDNNIIIKASYVMVPLSPNMLSILKEQVPDPQQYKEYVNLLERHKYYYSLYVNNKTRESVFVLDSVKAQHGVSPSGNLEYVLTFPDGKFYGKENFLRSDILFADNLNNIEWQILDETKEIHGYICQNATIKDNSDISVWFTSDIPINRGIGYFQGLFGLVLEANDFFVSTYLTHLESSNNAEEFDTLIKKYGEKEKGKELPFNKLLIAKQNAIKMMTK